jgi:ABC-type branched-subunit amino acid transport system ATPase component
LGQYIVRLRAQQIGALGIARTFQIVQPVSHLTVRECTTLGLFGTTEGRCQSLPYAHANSGDILEIG